MKIALVSQEYPPDSSGGIATQTFMKAKGLSALGHRVFVVSRSSDEKRHESEAENIVVIRIPGFENIITDMRDVVQWLSYSMSVASELESLHKRENLEIIDFAEWGAEGYIHLLNRYQWNYVPVVIQLHGPLVMFSHIMNWPEKNSAFYRVGTHMEATCIRLADAVYSSSDCSAQWIRSYYHPGIGEIPVIHTGIDTTLFTPQAADKHKQPTIIFVGKFVRNKGVVELVEAAAQLIASFPGLRLEMIGPGEEDLKKELRKKAIALKAPDLLQFPGLMQKHEVAQRLSRAHVFAAPSHYEGGPGFVYLEAMACGLPVVACSGSGVSEIVTDGENGFLVPPADVQALKEALAKLLSDKALAARMGANAWNYVIKEADSNHCLQKLEAFYQSVLTSIEDQQPAI